MTKTQAHAALVLFLGVCSGRQIAGEPCRPCGLLAYQESPYEYERGTIVVTPDGQPRYEVALVNLPSAGPALRLAIAYVPGYDSPWIGSEGEALLGTGWSFTLPCLVRGTAGQAPITLILEGRERIEYFDDGEEGRFASHRLNALPLVRQSPDMYVLEDPAGKRIRFAGFTSLWPAPLRGKPLYVENPWHTGSRAVQFDWSRDGVASKYDKALIPPRREARLARTSAATRERNRNIREQARLGKRKWHTESGYSKRSKVETTFYRYKTLIGPAMRARGLASQRVEARIGCKILNTMTELGMPCGEMIG
jgi:hypothetical protein